MLVWMAAIAYVAKVAIMNNISQRILRPAQTYSPVSKRFERFLLLCCYDPKGISTVPENVAYLQMCSEFPITILNLFEHRSDFNRLKLSKNLNLSEYQGLVIHNTVAYDIDNLMAVDANLVTKFKHFDGIKILMKQDENFKFCRLAKYIGETGFDLIFTCLPKEAIEQIYPRSVVGDIRFERMLTGYVTPTLRNIDYSNNYRPIDIGYRGSIQPLSFGRLAYEKRSIGDGVLKHLVNSALNLDISSRWEDRFGGSDWLHFLLSCKATLGLESGASVFDIDGSLESRCSKIEEEIGAFSDTAEYAEAYLKALSDLEGVVHYHQISPRHFEAAAAGTLQLMYPGGYSDIFVANRHYFALKRDLTNLDEAIDLIKDDKRRNELVQASFEEIILDPKNWIETFVSKFDQLASEIICNKRICLNKSKHSFNTLTHNVLLLASHEPSIDPRLSWIEQGAPQDINIHQLGVSPEREHLIAKLTSKNNLYIAAPRVPTKTQNISFLLKQIINEPLGMAVASEFLFINYILSQGKDDFSEVFAAPISANRNTDFRWYLRFLLDTNISLIESAMKLRNVHALIATDLVTLPAALILKSIFKIPVLYDAHEYWPEADVRALEYEEQYWRQLERRLVPYCDYCQTVSPGLAEIMQAQYGNKFSFVPNCVPIHDGLINHSPLDKTDKCSFLFLGSFAPGRGIELLIQAWSKTSESALLLLRGPVNPFSEELRILAASTGLLGVRIFFLEPVHEDDLIKIAADADVGLIPYTPLGLTYANCSPNKLSQYMAAGLPILANNTYYVKQVIADANCGIVIDFIKEDLLINAINELTNSPSLRSNYSKSARKYFENHFNWEQVSQPFYDAINILTAGTPKEEISTYFKNVTDDYGQNERDVKSTNNNSKSIDESIRNTKRFIVYTIARNLWHLLPLTIRKRYGDTALRWHDKFKYN